MQRITGLPEEQVLAYEAQAEAAMRAALEHVMDVIARRVEASMPVLASVLVAADQGDIIPPSDVPAGDGLPPGQPYVSPDDLASIPPLWQTAVEQQILPIVAQVFLDAAGRTYAGMVEASSIAGLPSVGSLAAERYLAQAQNTFEQVGDDLWATARTELSDGFERGESIPQLAERLRASAGVTARTGVLVARTQVNEASNAGSFATAQASGLKMQKEWIATPDLRTRPEHLAADGQRVDLADPFIVGGYSAMYPAAPSLPPSMRFNCRCTIGYVMPDRAITQMRESLAQQNEQEQLPGTEGPLTIFHPKPAEPGGDLGPLLPEPVVDPRAIRLAYRQAKTSDELRAAWQDEMRRITSRDIIVQMPPGASVLTMRQYAEGVTQMLERFPEARLRKVSWWSDGTTGDYARIARGSATIEFNAYWAADVHRAEYLRALRHDVSGWTGPEKSGWSVRGASTPQATAYHEFAHILDIETLSDGAKFRALDIATRRAVVRGVSRDELIASDVSAYASSNGNELIAEAMTDVMVNGQRASAASREIYDLIVADYKARGLAVRTTTHVADELTDEEIAALFPKPRDPLAVRPVLEAARTTTAVERAFTAEFERITGRRPRSVSFIGSAATAREHAEGLLRGLERFPDAKLDLITAANIREKVSYAQATGSRIDFNYEWTSPAARKKYLDSLAGDVAGWDRGIQEFGIGIFRSSAFHPRGTGNPIAVALHEFGHVLDIETTTKAIRPELEKLLRLRTAEAKRLGRLAPETPIIDQEDLIFREISSYATKNDVELVAEAFSDVMMNGQAASALSREIFDLLEAEYKRGGGVVRAATDLGQALPTRAGEIFPKAPAPKMKPVTVARGKDLTGDEDLAARAQREAEREHADTGLTPAGFPIKPEAYQGDYAFHEIANAQGFNGLPRIVADDDQWQRLLDEGDYIPLYRGHGWAGGDGVAQVDAFNYGERYVGGGFAPGNNMSPRYETALHYADGHDAAVGHYALRSDAKIVTFPDLVAQRDAYVAKLAPDSIERTLYDGNLGLGRFGAAKGYDAMVVPRGETLLTDRAAEWVIFNRTKIVAYDDSAKGVAAARAGGKAVPAKITAGERARRAKDEAVTAGRSVGHLTRELDQMIAEGGDEAFRSGALWRRIQAKGSELGTPPDVLRALSVVARSDNKGASLEALRAEIDKANLDAGVRRIGAAGDVVRFDARRDQTWGLADDVKIADGDLVTVLRPGSVIEYQGKPLQIAAPRVRPATPQEIAASPTAPAVVAPMATKNLSNMGVAQLRALAKERGIPIPAGARKADLVKALSESTAPLDEKALLRAAARERNRLIESSQGTAKLLAEVDELIANKATKAAIRQRLDPALIAPEQVYAGADPAIVDALRKALDTGDPVKLRSALTRAGTKAKLKPVSKAGAKATFDAETMEGVGGIEIAPGAQVTVVRRGTTLTLPDGSTMQLTRAQVTPIVPKVPPVKAVKARPGPAAMTQARADAWAADSKIPFELQHGTTPESAAAITQSGFDLARLGSKTDFGNLGAGFYFNPAGSISYAEAPGYGASLAVRARVDKVMLTSSREYARGRAVEDYIDIMHSSGEAAARQYLDSKVISSTVEGRFIAPKGMTNRDLIGPISDEQVSRYLAIRQDGKVSGFVLREWSIDEGYGAIVWDFPGSVIPGYPVRNGATWFEVNVLKPEDIVVIKPSVPVKRAPRGITEVKLPPGQRGQDVFPVQWMIDSPTELSAAPRAIAAAERDRFAQAIQQWVRDKPKGDAVSMAQPYVNAALRGTAEMTPARQATVEALDDALAASRSTRSVTLYRGFTSGEHILPDDWQTMDLAGLRWEEKGFTAASDQLDFAETYAGEAATKGFAIRFTLPKGSHGVSIRDVTGGLDDEGEVLLPRGMEFHVIADRGIQGDYGVRWLDVEIRPKKIPIKATKRAPETVSTETAFRDIDGRHASAWGREHFTAPAELSPAELQAAKNYAGGAYQSTNRYLRTGQVGPSNRGPVLDDIRGLDSLLQHETVPEDIIVSRAGSVAHAFGGRDPSSMVGEVISDPGYLSTTVGGRVSGVAAKRKTNDVVMQIEVPAGTHGYYMGRGIADFAEERELLLPRDTMLQIISAKKVGFRWHVVARVVPKAVKAPTKAVVRQAAIDEARQVGDLAAEVLELSNNGASVAALRSRITATAKRLGTPDEVRDALLEVTSHTGDVLRAQALQQLERAGITPIGAAGQVVKFDRKIHDPIAGVKAGDLVVVDRPGLTFTRDGEKIQLAKAKVGPAPEGSTVAKRPLTVDEYQARLGTAVKGEDALDSVPLRVVEEGRGIDAPSPPPMYQALREYRRADFIPVNGLLRAGPGDDVVKFGRTPKRVVPLIDDAMDTSRLTADVEIWRAPGSGRGIFGDPATWGDDLAGFEWIDPAYSSASTVQKIANRFLRNDGVRLRILVPKGTKAVRLSDYNPNAGGAGEAEILLGRGAHYRVVADRGWVTEGRYRIRDLDVEVVVPDETPPPPWVTK